MSGAAVATVLTATLTDGHYLIAALQQGSWVLPAFDLTALGTGLFLGWAALKFRTEHAEKPVRKSAGIAVSRQEAS